MPKKEPTVIDELAEQADTLLNVAWEKLAAQKTTREDVIRMVKGWRLKYKIHQVKEEGKEL